MIAYYLMMNGLVLVSVLVEVLRSLARGKGLSGVRTEALLGNGWGYILCVLAGLTILYAWKGADFFRDALAAGKSRMKIGTFAVLAVLCLGAQTANSIWLVLLEWVMNWFGRSALELLEMVSGASGTVSMFVYASFLAPISEEILFRGLCLRTLEPFGKRLAIFCSAFLFGIFHGNLMQTPYAFLMGLVLGYTAMEYSIWWAIALHLFNNLAVADLLSRLMEVLPVELADMVSGALFGGAAIASAVLLVCSRGKIRVYRSERMDRRCLKCFFTSAGVVVLIVLMAVSMLVNL